MSRLDFSVSQWLQVIIKASIRTKREFTLVINLYSSDLNAMYTVV